MSPRAWIGRRLRFLADRIDPDGGPRAISWSFTFEPDTGIKFRDDRRGCPLWYLGEASYQRAHDESDAEHVQIDWTAATYRHVGGPPKT